ncbi:hypothetical protein PS1_014393 [Malus domestica]
MTEKISGSRLMKIGFGSSVEQFDRAAKRELGPSAWIVSNVVSKYLPPNCPILNPAPICTTIHFIETKSKLCIRVSLTHPWWSELKNCVFVRMKFLEHANWRKTTREIFLSCQLREHKGH